jgi:hypothetical protein
MLEQLDHPFAIGRTVVSECPWAKTSRRGVTFSDPAR